MGQDFGNARRSNALVHRVANLYDGTLSAQPFAERAPQLDIVLKPVLSKPTLDGLHIVHVAPGIAGTAHTDRDRLICGIHAINNYI